MENSKTYLKNITKFLTLAASMACVSCSTMANTSSTAGQESAQATKMADPNGSYQMNRTRLINSWLPIAEEVEGFYPYIYTCSGGHNTIGIGSEIKTVGLENLPIRYKNGKLLTLAQKKAYNRAVRSTSYTACKRIADKMGIAGIKKEDAYKLAFNEAIKKVDRLYLDLQKRGIDLFDQPLAFQTLVLDFAYQRGSAGVFRQKAFWRAFNKKQYDDMYKHVVCCGNVDRNIIKRNLAKAAAAVYKGKTPQPYLAVLETKYGIKMQGRNQKHMKGTLLASLAAVQQVEKDNPLKEAFETGQLKTNNLLVVNQNSKSANSQNGLTGYTRFPLGKPSAGMNG